jgi:fucose permease
VDAALNHYVALHYASRHMSWLHCFWGVGCALSPYIMSFYLHRGDDWQGGYRAIAVLQIILTAVLFRSLPLWKRSHADDDESAEAPLPMRKLLRQRGVLPVLVTFFSYCALESTAGLWASSYLVQVRGIGTETAARFASLFYIGITAGRFLSGFVADRLGDHKMIRLGLCGIAAGTVMVLLPFGDLFPLCGLVVIGFGCAPVYPSVIHATPANFGAENSQAIIGVQMASAYVGSTFAPPLFGFLSVRLGLVLLPVYVAGFGAMMIAMVEIAFTRAKEKIKARTLS